jgi:dipeptidyl aminopeptidase/acylaminoacyl peptidase
MKKATVALLLNLLLHHPLDILSFAPGKCIYTMSSRKNLSSYHEEKQTNNDDLFDGDRGQASKCSSIGSKLSASTTSADIIPRDKLFGNPTYAAPKLSPDGKYISYLAPSIEGVLNVFVRLTLDENNSQARMVTKDTSRGIRQYRWAPDGETILYLQDFEGDENFHLWAIDATGTSSVETRDLTPGENVKASNLITNKRFPDEILVATNERNPTCFDMYRVHYKTGEKTLDTENPGDVLGWGSEDSSFEVREALVKNQEDSSSTIRVRDDLNSEWRDLATFPYGEKGNLVEFCLDGKTCWMTSNVGRETTALLKVDLQTGEIIDVVSTSDACDVGSVDIDDDTKEIQVVSYNYARTERKFFDKDLEKDYENLKSLGPANSEVSTVSKTNDKKLWIVAFSRSDGPTEYSLYDQEHKTMKHLFVSKPDLLGYKFSPMEDVRIQTRDGLELVGYLTKADTEKKTPLVLLVHVGPWARDYWGFNQQAQWFANRGYATLQVNFRGSTGYGKKFLHMGDRQWGVGTMQHDLTDSVQWAIDKGITDPEKICIYGGSYGGYATLAGLTFTPELYKCGVDIVGPSNIKTLLDSIPSYWGPLRNDMLKKIGDVDTDEEFNRKISPLYHVDKIVSPLLIGQGANDPRVKQAEADQIAFAMQKKGIPVEYVLYPDEGHGFGRPDNRIDFNGRAEQFLAKHLGGRAEEFKDVDGATATFPLIDKLSE